LFSIELFDPVGEGVEKSNFLLLLQKSGFDFIGLRFMYTRLCRRGRGWAGVVLIIHVQRTSKVRRTPNRLFSTSSHPLNWQRKHYWLFYICKNLKTFFFIMTMKHDDVLSKLVTHNQDLAGQYGIDTLYLFGSVARDGAREDSDVDLLVEFKYPIGLFEFIELQQRLETLLGCKVDLGTKRSLNIHLVDQVLQEAIRVA
jgi:predicted nucleotidyltransferase